MRLITRALRGPGRAGGRPDPGQLGEWIADVERPAPENRSRYQHYLDDIRELIGEVCPPPLVNDSQAPALAARIARRQRPSARTALTARVRCPEGPCLAGLAATVRVDGRRRSFRVAPMEPGERSAATLRARLPRAVRQALAANVADPEEGWGRWLSYSRQ